MIKKDWEKELRDYTGCPVVTRKQLAAVLGCKDPHNVARYLDGLQRLPGKKYFIPDVAAAIMREVEVR